MTSAYEPEAGKTPRAAQPPPREGRVAGTGRPRISPGGRRRILGSERSGLFSAESAQPLVFPGVYRLTLRERNPIEQTRGPHCRSLPRPAMVATAAGSTPARCSGRVPQSRVETSRGRVEAPGGHDTRGVALSEAGVIPLRTDGVRGRERSQELRPWPWRICVCGALFALLRASANFQQARLGVEEGPFTQPSLRQFRLTRSRRAVSRPSDPRSPSIRLHFHDAPVTPSCVLPRGPRARETV